jgi:hypothetical protein
MALVGGGAVAFAGGNAAGASEAPFLIAAAGGSQVHALDSTATSALTAESQVGAWGPGQSDNNSTPSVAVKGLVSIGDVTTSAHTDKVAGGYEVVAEAQTNNINLLNGLVKATSVTTTTTTALVNGKASGSSTTDVEGLVIAGHAVDKQIPPNFSRGIPGIAAVGANSVISDYSGASGMTIGSGLAVQLLKPKGSADKGTTIYVNPTFSAATMVSSQDHSVSAKAYGTSVQAQAGNQLVQVNSDPAAPVSTNGAGTGGKAQSSSVAGVHITSLASVGAVTNTVNGSTTKSSAQVTAQSAVNGINLFNGLVSASAIETDVKASSDKAASGSTDLAKLTVAGKSFPANVAPNTTLNVAGLGKVIINQQIKNGGTLTVRGLDITLTKKKFGLPAGAEVQVAVASASAS